MIGLTAELLELQASSKAPASGTVLEASLDRQRGPIATLVVEEGTLRLGENMVVGAESGKVRAMVDDRGQQIKEAPPSTAVEVLGLGGVPEAGDHFQVVEAATLARKVSSIRHDRQRRASLASGSRLTLDDLHAQLRDGERVEMAVLVKADAQGSVEVLRDSLSKLSGDKVEVKIIHAAPGGITESDVLLASASNAIVVGFNVRPERGVADIASREDVDLRLYLVIYQLLDEFKRPCSEKSSRSFGKRLSAPQRCAILSASLASAPLPVATLPTERSPATRASVWCEIRSSSSTAGSARCDVSKTTYRRFSKDSNAASPSPTSLT